MKNAQSSLSLRSVTARAFVSLAALALLVPTAAGQQEPNRPGERKVDEKPIDALTPSMAQLEELVAKAEALLKAGDRAGARAACKEALALAALDRATPEWLAAADGVLWRLGFAARDAVDIRSAHDTLQAVHRHREATLPDDHPKLQWARNNLANTKKMLGDLPGALELQEKVLAVRLATLPDDHPDLQSARGNLARTKKALGDLLGALALQEKVTSALSATLPDDHPDLQEARGDLALTKLEMGELAGALELQEKVLAVRLATLPDAHPDLQSARNNLATTKREMGDLVGALELQERVLAVRLATLPDDHADLQSVRVNLANTKRTLGDLSGALALEESALTVLSATLPADHPHVQAARSGLAGTKFALGDLPSAMTLMEGVLAARLAKLPDSHPDLQSARANLAIIKRQLGDLAGSLALTEKVLAVRLATLPDDHPDLQVARNNLAEDMRELGDLAGALVLQQKVLTGLSAMLPDDHPYLQAARNNLAITKHALGDSPGALALEEKVFAVASASLPDDHLHLQVARSNRAATKAELGDLPGALALLEKVLTVLSVKRLDDHPDLQRVRGSLANTKQALGDLEGAAQLHRAAVAGALRRLSTQTASLRDIVQLARQATAPLSHVASLLDLGTAVPAEIAALLRVDGLHLLEATRSAPLHLARLQQFIRTQHPDASARLLPRLAQASRRLEEAIALTAVGGRGPNGKQISRDDAIREVTLAKDAIEREWLALVPPDGRISPDAATFAKALAQDEVAISFCTYTRGTNDREKPWVRTSQERYGAFLIRSSGEVTWHSLAATAEVDAVVAEIRQLAIASRPKTTIASRLSELRALLLDPVLAAVPEGTKSLVLSLADGMHLMPLDDISLASGEMLGDAFSVRSVWSLRTLLEAPRGRSAEPTVLVVGCPDYNMNPASSVSTLPEAVTPIFEPLARADVRAEDATSAKDHRSVPRVFEPLIHTKREAEALATVFKESFAGRPAPMLLAAAASKTSVVAQAPGKSYLHFATHGYFAPELALQLVNRGDQGPLARFDIGQRDRVAQLSPYSLTGIVLTGANLPVNAQGHREGILTAQELVQLDLSACYLATLSACDSSLGVRQAGSGLASLRQSFHAAGARYVLATLWRVDDKVAADLMIDFYTRVWQQGQDPHSALRAAKTRVDKRGALFRDWAGWVLTGR